MRLCHFAVFAVVWYLIAPPYMEEVEAGSHLHRGTGYQ
jgi:hypothetical protein